MKTPAKTFSADSYQTALHYLYSFVDYEKQPGASPKRMTLEKIESLCGLLGHPHRRYPVVHITGTKGKGSTAAMIASILHRSGLRTGLYTSPHLVTLRERIAIDGDPIPQTDLCWMTDRLHGAIETMSQHPGGGPETFFDVWTALAFLYFAERQVDIAVVEVGLGGRLDSTNIVQPVVCVITPIGLDHTDRLGNTIAEIACEKAGIVKDGVPVVIGPQESDALAVISATCNRRESRVIRVGEDIRYAIRHSDPDRQVFDVTGCRGCYESLEIPLAGEYQAVNAATAVGAVEVLQDRGFRISAEDIAEGLRSVRWPGRLQVVGRRPWVVLDGAHNAMAVRTFIQSIRVFSHDRSIVVLSFQQDKAIEEMCRAFATWADICIVPSRRVMRRRQADPALVVSLIEGFGGTAEAVGTVAEALDRAQALAGPADLICVTGSLALVGETMEVLHQLEPEEIRSREA